MEFTPSPKLIKIYWLYSLWFFIPLAILSVLAYALGDVIVSLIMLALIIGTFIFLVIWIPRFYSSIRFKLEQDYAYARYGVWWIREKRVPYNLISKLSLRQGPIQRYFKLANLDIFTPATGVERAELSFFQLDYDHAVRVHDTLRAKIGILTTQERRVIEKDILEELRRIRSILEELAEHMSK